MEKNIIYDYEDRDTIMTDLIHKLLNKLYSISYPHTDKTFDELCEEYEAKSKGAYKYPIDFFYLPQKISTTIVHDFLEKHGIAFHWKDNMEFLIDILFNRGGIKEVYGPTDWSKEPLRHCIDVPTLDKIIPKEYADKVQGVLEGYANTYKFGRREYNGALFSVFDYAPCSSRERVINAYKEIGEELTIPKDDCWKDIYEAEEEEMGD